MGGVFLSPGSTKKTVWRAAPTATPGGPASSSPDPRAILGGPVPEKDAEGRIIADNRKALHDYHVIETFEAGVVLLGTEVKAIREGRVTLRDAYAGFEKGELFLHHVNISPYSHRGYADHEPLRRRKLLLHKDEIKRLIGKVEQKGYTLVPINLHWHNGRVKCDIALARGKAEHDKRDTIKDREGKREVERVMKSRHR